MAEWVEWVAAVVVVVVAAAGAVLYDLRKSKYSEHKNSGMDMKTKKKKSGIMRTLVIVAIVAASIGLGPRGVRYVFNHSAKRQRSEVTASSAGTANPVIIPSSNGEQLGKVRSDYQVIVENDLLKPLGWQKTVETVTFTRPAPMLRRERPLERPGPMNYLMVTGITQVSEEPMALVEDVSGKEAYFLKEGDNLKNYVVANIEEENIVLTNGNSKITVALGTKTYYNSNGGLLADAPTDDQTIENIGSSEETTSLDENTANMSLIERMRERRRKQLE